MTESILPQLPSDEYFYISPEGLADIAKNFDPKEPLKNIIWTTNFSAELPIIMKKSGVGARTPQTIPEMFKEVVFLYRNVKALAHKINGKWKYWTYEEFYALVQDFANALISLGLNPMTALNIIGFNHPAWFVAFYGALFANIIPVGVYTTNGPDACKYLAEHSKSQVVMVENYEHLVKYLKVWDQLPNLKYIIIYADKVPADLPANRKSQVMTYEAFLEIGAKFTKDNKDKIIHERLLKQKPGHVCTLVYTSGTTGNPKAVMLSHDNYTWVTYSYCHVGYKDVLETEPAGQRRFVSYLPLSHVAAQFAELIAPISMGFTTYFADPSALQGSLIETLREVRPSYCVSVPRIWEKIEETMKKMAKENGAIKKKLADWAKSMGVEGTFAEIEGKDKPFGWDLAKTIVYNNVKKALGLDNCKMVTYGAAPLNLQTRTYFCQLNIFLINTFGMSECAGPTTFFSTASKKKPNLNSCGFALEGTSFFIVSPDRDGNGEICMRGRHRFMGYLDDDANTKQTIDPKGYLHSGDLGHVDKEGHLYITGRLKELLVTAGGENVAPLLIENEVRIAIPEVGQCVVIGDNRKYLTVLLTMKHVQEKVGYPGKDIDPSVLKDLAAMGVKGKTPEELRKDPNFIKYIDEGLNKANSKAISRAQTVRKWYLLDRDFSIEFEEVTPTLKLKRAVITKRYANEIESMYPPDAKL